MQELADDPEHWEYALMSSTLDTIAALVTERYAPQGVYCRPMPGGGGLQILTRSGYVEFPTTLLDERRIRSVGEWADMLVSLIDKAIADAELLVEVMES